MASAQTAPIPATLTPEEQAILTAYQQHKAVDVLTELTTLWQECQAVERRGVHVGERLYKLRELHSAQGNHTGKGFLQLLQQAGWVQRTAYYWLNKYEETIGVRPAPTAAPAVTEDDPELAAMFEQGKPADYTYQAPSTEPKEVVPSVTKQLRAIFEPMGLEVKPSKHGFKYDLCGLSKAQMNKIAPLLLGTR
ncbi:MAG TPA: hypothetical protein VN950_01290 [Terriglobales bacterium]|nr:hypothetical protein [Terriglobales bacterium]